MNKRILVPYDFSKASEHGVRYAIDYAGSLPGVDLQFCLIADQEDPERFEEARTRISSGISRIFQGELSWTTLIPGSVDGLLEKCTEEKADMVIMGTEGSSKADANTKTAELVLKAMFPVLVVPSGTEEEFKLGRIALVLGSNEIDDPNLLHTLLQIARRFNASVTVLTIASESDHFGYTEPEERNEHLLEYYLESFYSHHVYIKNEDVVAGIFDYVDAHDIDLVTILPNKHVKKGTPSEGRLTRILAQQSSTPLLTIEH
ncbi:universal stress protein [Robiginitalea aurantiaca]|uniref:Universal stress protein n=1 Tax=Robiginitalea aurantiaca TaxID=3056915 RepID=A0ABT7WI03_9FLAO|nr:universal stress protein [Robiginitalea aurantiaca]MDM9632540.1 universal stress protein [Robiginitalea aurantiaca]